MNSSNLTSPITFNTSIKQSPCGTPKFANQTVEDIERVLKKWDINHIHGIKTVAEIIKLIPGDPSDLTTELPNFCDDLSKSVENCREVVESLRLFHDRIEGLNQLKKEDDELFDTLHDMVKKTKQILEAYGKELKNKELVLEHIAFTKSLSEAVFFGSLWKYQIYIDDKVQGAIYGIKMVTDM